MRQIKMLSKWKNLSVAAKSTVAFTFSSLLIKGISFITVPIFTRVLDSTQYGVVAVYNSWLSIIEVFALLGMTSAGVFNVGLNEHKENRSSYVSSVLSICNLVTLLCFALVYVLTELFEIEFLPSDSLMIAMLVHFLFSPAMTFWVSFERFEYRYKTAVIVTVFYTVISQLATVLILLISGNRTAEFKVWGTVLTSLMFQLPIYFLLFKKGKKFFSASIWKFVVGFTIPLLPHYLAQHVMAGADKIMVTNLQSEEAAAIYSVALNIGMIATIIWNALNASLLPWIYEQMNKKSYSNINGTILPLLSLYASGCILLTLLAPEILKILAPESYSVGVYAVPAVMGTAFMSALYNIYANVEFYYKKTSAIALATIVATVANIVMNGLLIPQFGFEGAAYATLCSYIVLIIVHYMGYRGCQKTRVYKDHIVLAISAVSILCIVAVRVVYNMGLVRYAIMIGLICVSVYGAYRLIRNNNPQK